ncbi:hypothetical protein A7K93_10145 [Candidatus Methylacidiphilum fumarolicum]|uniref:Uncharacterized protein n=2 Tax=Candidatus Methylacidiphilum fumarolicum TaxID=591154 RepID=I0JZP1_METFB|nr:hypothetical protein [Candidatus Methylacidiphilum fumarolicum]MBW6414604.1 hypothetical protein [Candidatus Methylacidiphilum fumarolicum]TFE70886.1 hypothetical protein A7K73_03035 [Candidatus Methylacidiphilum fumarolicum]TFE71853.1 hypothetical protein A7K93_10145 [Candidatus Methylacidiphilum fumarolicum]TFE75147.1 hypothetical protein A7K72_02240 [Candidatus Methylacidiphilum fumarolicum]TFE77393.1 hypothetical protein A7D33_04665 [Candidatus Methylacidiphilum fumarolicum]
MKDNQLASFLKERLLFYASLCSCEEKEARQALEEAFSSADNPEGVFDTFRVFCSGTKNKEAFLRQWIEMELHQFFIYKEERFCFDPTFSKPLAVAMLPIKRRSMKASVLLEPNQFLKIVAFFGRLQRKSA